MFKRFMNWVRAVFNRGMDKLEDPDIMLDQARRDMQETLTSNREKAVQAITQKNRLSIMLKDAEKKASELESQAGMALRQGNRDLARQLMREKMQVDNTITSLRGSYEQAVQVVDSIKIAIKRQEEEVRKKTAEALAMKAQWKQAQIQNSIAKALEGLTFENQLDSFNVAADRVKEAQSEAMARQEMMANSIQGKIMSMEDVSMDYAAEEELQKLEQRLGMGAPAPVQQAATDQTVSVSQGGPPPAPIETSEIDSQLEELERRMGGQSST